MPVAAIAAVRRAAVSGRMETGLLELGLVHVLPGLGIARGLERDLRPAQEVGGHLRQPLVVARQFTDRHPARPSTDRLRVRTRPSARPRQVTAHCDTSPGAVC